MAAERHLGADKAEELAISVRRFVKGKAGLAPDANRIHGRPPLTLAPTLMLPPVLMLTVTLGLVLSGLASTALRLAILLMRSSMHLTWHVSRVSCHVHMQVRPNRNS